MNVLDIIGGMFGLYRVVPPDEAHVRIMFNKREVFSSQIKDGKMSYWVIPFVTDITRLPLTNIRIDVPDIKLNDKNMAKFVCDINCFVHIVNPLLAAERTGITIQQIRYEGYKSLTDDFRIIIESIGRTVATKQTILEIYNDRDKLDDAVRVELSKVLPGWGLELVDMEIREIKDAEESTIISDIEKKEAAKINADARVQIAIENKRATISEAENLKEAEMKKAITEEEWKKRQIEKERTISIATQEKNQKEAEQAILANEKAVEAKRKLDVGYATVAKETTIQIAEGQKAKAVLEASAKAQATELEGNATANVREITGKAEASVKEMIGKAEAIAIEKIAEAKQKYTGTALNIELINANKEVGLKQAEAYAAVAKNAKINIISGSSQEIMSGGLIGKINAGPKEAIALQQLIENNPELVELISSKLKLSKTGLDNKDAV